MMLNFKPITLDDKELFHSYVDGHGYRQAESSFANMYMWQEIYDIRMAEEDGVLYFTSSSGHSCPFILMPYIKDKSANVAPSMKACEEHMTNKGCRFIMKAVMPEFVEKVREEFGERYLSTYDDNNSEYVYRAADLIELKGKKFHAKRNHVNKFLRDYTAELDDYAPRYYEECVELQKQWARNKNADEQSAKDELNTIKRALENFEYLNLRGCVVKIAGEVVAFSVGEQISEDTALIHIEKANDDFNGLFAYVNREFVANYWSHCEYINREEDMGVPGLRQAKQSYNPAFMVEKYTLELNG